MHLQKEGWIILRLFVSFLAWKKKFQNWNCFLLHLIKYVRDKNNIFLRFFSFLLVKYDFMFYPWECFIVVSVNDYICLVVCLILWVRQCSRRGCRLGRCRQARHWPWSRCHPPPEWRISCTWTFSSSSSRGQYYLLYLTLPRTALRSSSSSRALVRSPHVSASILTYNFQQQLRTINAT